MSNRQHKSKPMCISDISKRMTTRSQIREQSSTSVPNPPKVTNTESINITVDGYTNILTEWYILLVNKLYNLKYYYSRKTLLLVKCFFSKCFINIIISNYTVYTTNRI